MSANCKTLEEYGEDKRIACKYGAKCYQKNSLHINKYKHPPKISKTNDDNNRPAKRRKVEPSADESKNDNEIPKAQNLETTEEASGSNENILNKHEDESKVRNVLTNDTLVYEKGSDVKEYIKKRFLFEMPDDFYSFWNVCEKLNKKNPESAFAKADLLLVGPYDVLSGKFNEKAPEKEEDFLLHWRYFYDPPEFQTVIKGNDKTGFHIGYYRDDPKENPVFLAKNCAAVDGEFQQIGENIFASVYNYLEDMKKTVDPFKKMSVVQLQTTLKKEAESLKFDLSAKTNKMKQRIQKVVTKTFNKAGLVVPLDKKTQVGYRELAMNNKDLKIILDKLKTCSDEQRNKILSELQPVMTYASIAMDECDFGTGVELGLNILASGVESLNATASRYLTSANKLLGREEFAKIAEVHLKNRKKGCNLSVV